MNFFISILLVFFFGACSHKNAFYEFSMDKRQEQSATSLKRIKIVKDTKVIGTFNALYLNNVYPEKYNKEEYFIVYIYLKEIKNISNPNTINRDNLKILLNNNEPIKLEELDNENRFFKLTGSKNKWNKYYLVSFDAVGESLSLKLESDQSFSVVLKYQKDQL